MNYLAKVFGSVILFGFYLVGFGLVMLSEAIEKTYYYAKRLTDSK